MSDNPYQAPTSLVADPVAPGIDGEFSPEPHVRPAGAGAAWLRQGWDLFAAAPGVWLVLVLIWGFVAVVLLLVPLLGPLVQNLMFPLFAAGVMLGCHGVARGEPFTLACLFAGFSRNTGQLLLVGTLYLVGVIAVSIAVFVPLGIGTAFGPLLGGAPAAQEEFMRNMLLAMLIFMAATLPLVMAVWFAPALVAINGLNAFDAMKASFMGCLKNTVPFLVYGLFGLGLAVAATLPIFLGWLVLGPVLLASCYASYRDIYYAQGAGLP